jgi:hypothetical protein
LKKKLKNKSYNTILSDCDYNELGYLVEHSTDGDDNFGQSSNVTFYVVADKEETVEDLVKESDNDDDLLQEYELIYTKWLEGVNQIKALKREV